MHKYFFSFSRLIYICQKHVCKTLCASVHKGYMILSSCLISSPCNADILSRMQRVRLRRAECPLMTFLAPHDLLSKSHPSRSLHTETDTWGNSAHLNHLASKISQLGYVHINVSVLKQHLKSQTVSMQTNVLSLRSYTSPCNPELGFTVIIFRLTVLPNLSLSPSMKCWL